MLNIVVPMAGHGSRFSKAGYLDPKPLIPIHGMPMIELVIRNLTPLRPHRFVFVCQRTHIDSYPLLQTLQSAAPGCEVIPIDGVTDGAASTVLLARHFFENRDPLMIANCDQYLDYSIDTYLDDMDHRKLDGLIMTMPADSPKWSYVSYDSEGYVSTVVEKKVISDQATVGIYNYAKGVDFVRAAVRMIANNERVNGEFYVAPVYNSFLAEGARIGFHDVGSAMYGLGVPEDLESFLLAPVSSKCLSTWRDDEA